MHKKKLIEVAIPLDAINAASAYEKLPGIGAHPRGLHLWWARRPLATCRAVLFASLVDDPSAHPERFPTEVDQDAERDRLFALIERLVRWENRSDEKLLDDVRAEIRESCGDQLPTVRDPFAGGGSIPLEAHRLGLASDATDLNPVAVTINKALSEIPEAIAGLGPVNTGSNGSMFHAPGGLGGLIEDVRFYGKWVLEEARRKIGSMYPAAVVPGGGTASVIAWLWARAVECPNPACGATAPLVTNHVLSSKKGKQRWLEPRVDGREVSYEIGGPKGSAPPPPKLGRGSDFRCEVCGETISGQYIKRRGVEGALQSKLLAIVAEGNRERVYLPAEPHHVGAAQAAAPTWVPSGQTPERLTGGTCFGYGLTEWGRLFTDRQLVALATLSDVIGEARQRIRGDAIAVGFADDDVPLRLGGKGSRAYAEAVAVYLAFALDRCADFNNSLCRWVPSNEKVMNLFARQSLPMVWDYAEANILADVVGGFGRAVDYVADCIAEVPIGPGGSAVEQRDAVSAGSDSGEASILVSTDPPYYDNIGYADLSDFFYVWMRRAISDVYPDEFSTLLVPKAQELVATAHRFGGDRREANRFFEAGLGNAFKRMHEHQDPRFPLTVYYAFKQAEDSSNGTASTGWETMLEALLDAGLTIEGTWPVRSEQAERLIASGTNALATSIVLVCRTRPISAPLATRKEFVEQLKRELPPAMRKLQHSNIAPVDMAQAAIGPGMAVFSRYSKVVEADGSAMRVRVALELVNQVLDETLAGTDADFDAETRWAVTWFDDCGMNEGDFGKAELLSKSRNTSVPGLVAAGIVRQAPGRVRLLSRDEMGHEWNPATDSRLTVWEVAQHLILELETNGEGAAAALLRKVGAGLGDAAKELAYRLYLICERRGWAKEALSYNALVSVWSELTKLAVAESTARADTEQGRLL